MPVIGTWDAGELGAAVALLNRASERDWFPIEQVREAVLEDDGLRPELMLAARDGDEMVGVAVGVTRGEGAHVKLFAVAPERRRRGVGTELLAEIEARLAASGAKTVRLFADAPWYLRPGVDYQSTAMVSFFERRGYETRRPACNMSVDLAKAPLDTAADERRLLADGIVVRRLAAADEDGFTRYMDEKWGVNWRTEATRALRRGPVSTHVATTPAGEFIGFASHSVSGPGQFGPMGTNPELRGKGVGAVLLKRCMADLRDAGLAEADIQWVGPKGFYADAVGAVISRCFWQYEKALV